MASKDEKKGGIGSLVSKFRGMLATIKGRKQQRKIPTEGRDYHPAVQLKNRNEKMKRQMDAALKR